MAQPVGMADAELFVVECQLLNVNVPQIKESIMH